MKVVQHGCGLDQPNVICQMVGARRHLAACRCMWRLPVWEVLQYMCETDNPGLRDGTKRGNDNTAGGEQELCAVSRASISREMFSKLGERSHRWQWRFLPFFPSASHKGSRSKGWGPEVQEVTKHRCACRECRRSAGPRDENVNRHRDWCPGGRNPRNCRGFWSWSSYRSVEESQQLQGWGRFS